MAARPTSKNRISLKDWTSILCMEIERNMTPSAGVVRQIRGYDCECINLRKMQLLSRPLPLTPKGEDKSTTTKQRTGEESVSAGEKRTSATDNTSVPNAVTPGAAVTQAITLNPTESYLVLDGHPPLMTLMTPDAGSPGINDPLMDLALTMTSVTHLQRIRIDYFKIALFDNLTHGYVREQFVIGKGDMRAVDR
jgi:hypothetical protein